MRLGGKKVGRPVDLSEISSLVPNRQLTHDEALMVAEIQAARLLRISGITVPPVSVVQISRRAGIAVEFDRHSGEIGSVSMSSGRWRIKHSSFCSADMNATVAHQLKIILDRPFGDYLYPHQDVMAPGIRRHHVAEYFAACLTLPGEWIRQAWNEGHRDINSLSRLFGVNPDVMAFRLRSLKLGEPVARVKLLER